MDTVMFSKQWFIANAPMLVLGAFVLIQWIAFQVLLVHYHMFRQSLKKPTPDGIRFNTIEKVLSFQASQIDRIYGKLSDLNKEINTVATTKVATKTQASTQIASDSSFITLGELNLKKRLKELKATGNEFPTTAKSTKLS